MRRLVFGDGARDDLAEIAAYVAEASGSVEVASRLFDQLTGRCADLAALPGSLGRMRPEIGPDLRSIASGNYVIFFRYEEHALRIIGILEGHRDIVNSLEGRS